MTDFIAALRKAGAEATNRPWFANGLDIESSHVIVATTQSMLSDRGVKEAQDTADFIVLAGNIWPEMLAVIEAAARMHESHLMTEEYARRGCKEPLADVLSALSRAVEEATK